MKPFRQSSLALAIAAISAGLPVVAQAEENQGKQRAESVVLEEVIVNARRREENLQDVGVSMSVFTTRQIEDANIVNAGDLGMYTPSLQAVDRFGGDNTTFAIRGFSQELRTTASVGVYFAEVVAPRGANSQQSGDGAGPGNFFDLASVQVLKGPTGTLFGRNTTGGAVLLVPKKPTDEFEGYVEAAKGNYDMWQGQAVINVPVSKNLKLRFGVDRKEREGYLNNISGIGPEDFADVNYVAYRLSALWDISESVENYTIFRYSDSDTNGYPRSLLYCNPTAGFGAFCQNDLSARQAAGKDRYLDVYSYVPKPLNTQTLSQLINTTTWTINEDLVLKNILAYATFETESRTAIYGTNWAIGPAQLMFQMVGLPDGEKTTDQNTWVEEIQLQGTAFDKRLTWQAGLYFEKSKPGQDYGQQSAAFIACDPESITSSNPDDLMCNDLLPALNPAFPDPFGTISNVFGGVEYTNKAVYAQGTYDFNDMLSVTAGVRYTDDETKGHVREIVYTFPSPLDGVFPGMYAGYENANIEDRKTESASDEPTWLLEVDLKPLDDTMVYAKYIRGYRQGSVNVSGSSGLDTHQPETVDTYEIGLKQQWKGRVPATLNMAAFYNEFDDQQIQYGYFKPSGIGTTAILNAGSSVISGFELEGKVQPFEQLVLSVGYAYLDTEVKELEEVTGPISTLRPSTTTAEGEPLSFVPEQNYVVTATWLIPAAQEIGDMSFATTYVFTDEMQAASKASSAYYKLEDYEVVNLNFNWDRMFGSPVDFAAFVTNYTDEKYVTFLSGNWNNGMEFGSVGQPKMYGARIRYNF